MEDLKDAQTTIEKEQASGLKSDSEAGGSSRLELPTSSSSQKSASSEHLDGDVDTQQNARDEEDEITGNTVPERPGRDIRFGDLPHPRKIERENEQVLRNESAIDDSEEDIGRGPLATECRETPSRRNSTALRLRTVVSTGFPRAATFERVLSNSLNMKGRDTSPNSRRTSQYNATNLPYFTFTPTIGRNSVMPSKELD